jgi:hypothetical protein
MLDLRFSQECVTLCVNWLSQLLIFRRISSPGTLLRLPDFENECNGSYEMLVTSYQSTRLYIPENMDVIILGGT